MSLVETVFSIAEKRLDTVAMQIQHELKQACPKRSGEAASSVHIEVVDGFTRRIGSTNLHFYFADQGNRQKYSYFGGKRNKAAPNYKGNGSPVLVFEDGSVHPYASTYYHEGRQGFVKRVADRHR